MENNSNGYLKAYSVSIGKVKFQPIGFSLDLYNLVITQNAEPDPPVADIPNLNVSVHWSQLVWGHFVADLTVDEPKIHFNLRNVRNEQRNNLPIRREGWQQALESIYPLKIDRFTVRNAELTYVEKGPYKPLHLSHLNMFARNIRNIRSPEHVYPSDIHLDGIIFETGKISLDGNANFMAEPHVTMKAQFDLGKMDLKYFRPITDRYNLAVTGGHLSTAGDIEYATKEQVYRLKELTINGVRIDHIHLARTTEAEKQTAKEAAKSAKELSNKPTVTTEINRLKIVNGNFGFINKATDPKYRIFVSDTDITIGNFSNQFLKGPAAFRLTGKFMGSGATQITGTFRPEKKGPNFDLRIAIEQTDMKPMSDLFRAYGNFAIEAGLIQNAFFKSILPGFSDNIPPSEK